MNTPILILGATSGIARALAAQLASEKRDLILAGRNREELEKTAADLRLRHGVDVKVQSFVAEAFASHGAFCEEALLLAGGELAGVVLCYGTMAAQADAQKDFELVRQMIDVNYTSAVSVLNRFADHFEARRTGFLCAISSVAGDRGRQSNYLYGSTKAALNAYLEGLRVRLAKVGVPVITVKPGFVATRMTYGQKGLFLVASPERVGRDISRAIRRRKDEVYTPWFWWGIMAIIRNIPRLVFKRMKL